MTELALAHKKKNINDIHVLLGDFSEEITHANIKSIGIEVIGTFNHMKIVLWERQKRAQ